MENVLQKTDLASILSAAVLPAIHHAQPSNPKGRSLGMCVQISDGNTACAKGSRQRAELRILVTIRERQCKSTSEPQQKETCFEPQCNQHKSRSSPRLCPPQQSGCPQPGGPHKQYTKTGAFHRCNSETPPWSELEVAVLTSSKVHLVLKKSLHVHTSNSTKAKLGPPCCPHVSLCVLHPSGAAAGGDSLCPAVIQSRAENSKFSHC